MGNLLPLSQRQPGFLGGGRLVKIAHLDCRIQILPLQKWPALAGIKVGMSASGHSAACLGDNGDGRFRESSAGFH